MGKNKRIEKIQKSEVRIQIFQSKDFLEISIVTPRFFYLNIRVSSD